MNKLKIAIALLILTATMSCGENKQVDNTVETETTETTTTPPASTDTMVMRENQTDSATNGVSTDTTKK